MSPWNEVSPARSCGRACDQELSHNPSMHGCRAHRRRLTLPSGPVKRTPRSSNAHARTLASLAVLLALSTACGRPPSSTSPKTHAQFGASPGLTPTNEPDFNSLEDAKTDRNVVFKMQVGIIDIVHPLRSGPGLVLARWPGGRELFGRDEAWKSEEDFVFVPNGSGASRKYVLRHGERREEAEIFVAANGFRGAVERLVELATTTTMVMPPYERAGEPERLGEISVRSLDPERDTFIWTFHNVCLKVATRTGGADTRRLARRLQDFVEAHLVGADAVERQRPHLALPRGPLVVRTGETIHFALGRPDDRALTLLAMPNNLAIGVIEQGPDGLTLRGFQPGATTFRIVLADPATLLGDAATLTVTCEPARPASR